MRHPNLLLLHLVLLTGCDIISPFVNKGLKRSICDRDNDGLPHSSEYCDGTDCDDGNASIGEPTGWYRDVDIDSFGAGEAVSACTQPDGYVNHNGDCDDTDQLVSPDGIETCNGYDDNCDGNVDDENITVWYADVDKDSYGDPSITLEQCSEPEGYVDNSLDCSDASATINPDGTEVCDDGIDQDCNDVIDDADGSQAWYADVDKDSFGDAENSLYTCVSDPDGYVLDATDCDDGNALVNPAAAEICNDLIDNNCNSEIDTDTLDVLWYRDADEDGYGDQGDSVTDCAPPAGYVQDATDCQDTNTSVNPGATEVCNNDEDDNCDNSPNECVFSGMVDLSIADTILTGEFAGDLVAKELDASCDLNNDGIKDLIVSGYANSTTSADADVVWVLFGPLMDGTSSLSSADIIVQTLESGSNFSIICGDLTGDGVDDLVMGANQDDGSVTDSGAVYVFFGPFTTGTVTTDQADVQISGETTDEYFGWRVSMLDFNIDGQSDLVVSSILTSEQLGSIRLFLGPLTEDLVTSDADASLTGEENGDQSGYDLATGDLNNDGNHDLVVGAPYNDENGNVAGAVYVLYAPLDMSLTRLSNADLLCYGEDADDQLGFSVNTGDVDGDTLPDLLIGAPQESTGASGAGAVYILPAPGTGMCSLSAAHKLTGVTGSEYAGTSVVGGADLNDDGFPDLFVGAIQSYGLFAQSGLIYFVKGPITESASLSTATASFSGEASYDQAGWVIVLGDDLTDDGLPEMVVSSPYNDNSGSDAGAVYILNGLGY